MEQTRGMLLKLSIYGCILVSSSFLVWACQAIEVSNREIWGGEVKFEASGGFAGIRQSLDIRHDGTFVARDEKLKKEVRGLLDTTTLNELVTAFRSSDTKEKINKPGSIKRCADCLQYSIRASVDNRDYQVNINSVSAGTSEYDQVVRFLSKTLRESLTRPSAAHK